MRIRTCLGSLGPLLGHNITYTHTFVLCPNTHVLYIGTLQHVVGNLLVRLICEHLVTVESGVIAGQVQQLAVATDEEGVQELQRHRTNLGHKDVAREMGTIGELGDHLEELVEFLRVLLL
ncbi:hypothetical protein B0H13DRAFT_1927624 [Mycena leptocephala]|nr:hypothetical protein B0H13DRAFT_1927624 [Mycena leptocephala]